MGINKKAGMVVNVIVLIVVFLLGTFFGYAIIAKYVGVDLSPDNLSEDDLIESCVGIGPLIKDEICLSDIGEELVVEELGLNEGINESDVIE